MQIKLRPTCYIILSPSYEQYEHKSIPLFYLHLFQRRHCIHCSQYIIYIYIKRFLLVFFKTWYTFLIKPIYTYLLILKLLIIIDNDVIGLILVICDLHWNAYSKNIFSKIVKRITLKGKIYIFKMYKRK